MNPSDLYHQHGIREQVCTKAEYSGKEIILHIETKEKMFYCTHCNSKNVIRSGTVTREFKSVPVGGKPVKVRMKVQRLECKECGHVCQEHIHFADSMAGYTHRMKRYVSDLCRICTITAAAMMLGMSWNTVKEIVKAFLHRHYSRPDLSTLRHIGIDEFAAKKGHVYKTIVVNLETGQIVHVGEGKGAGALDGFWRELRKSGAHIESVASDLSAAYISAVRENIPDAVYVFDHFHLVKLVNEALDKVRKRIVREERVKENREDKGRYPLGMTGLVERFHSRRFFSTNMLTPLVPTSASEPYMRSHWLPEWKVRPPSKRKVLTVQWFSQPGHTSMPDS